MSLKQVFAITSDVKFLTEEIGRHINEELSPVLAICKEPFREINTEFKLLGKLEKLNLFRFPVKFEIEKKLSQLTTNGLPNLKNVSFKGTMLEIEFMLEHIFSLPNLLKATLQNMEELSKQTKICNFVNGSVWNEIKSLYVEKTVIPYNLYFDDFEPDNPLGSHKAENAIGAFYIGFPTMPQFLCSRLLNIFPVMFIKTKLLKDFSTDKCLQDLVNVLVKLEEEGIIINNQRVYFVLGAFIGDNLASNSLLGFAKSFSATFFCRVCKCSNISTSKDFKENIKLLRNVQNYNVDLAIKNFKVTGLRELCILNQ